MKDNSRRISDWEVLAQVFWGAALDKRPIDANKVIALLYYRLPSDKGSSENNLAWSIVCKLKGIEYISKYNPMEDQEIIKEKYELGIE